MYKITNNGIMFQYLSNLEKSQKLINELLDRPSYDINK